MKSSYVGRWGHFRENRGKGHPKRKARRERAYARGATKPSPKKEIA